MIAVILGMVIYGVFEGEGAGTLASSRPFWSGDAHVIPMITGATILCFSFTGFDGISNLSEETKDAERVIPRAIFPDRADRRPDLHLCHLLPAAVLPGYLSRFKDPDASQPEIMLYVAGKAFQVGALIFSTITVLASGMAGARWRGASDVRYGPRRRVPEKLLRLRAPDLAHSGDEHHPGRRDCAAGD